MVGGEARQRRAVHMDVAHERRRPGIDAVERQDWAPRREGAWRRGVAELAVERADAAAPAAPFVEIAHHEYRGVDPALLPRFRRAVARERTQPPAPRAPPLAPRQPL